MIIMKREIKIITIPRLSKRNTSEMKFTVHLSFLIISNVFNKEKVRQRYIFANYFVARNGHNEIYTTYTTVSFNGSYMSMQNKINMRKSIYTT